MLILSIGINLIGEARDGQQRQDRCKAFIVVDNHKGAFRRSFWRQRNIIGVRDKKLIAIRNLKPEGNATINSFFNLGNIHANILNLPRRVGNSHEASIPFSGANLARGERPAAGSGVHTDFWHIHRSMTNSSKFITALTSMVVAAKSARGSDWSRADSPIASSLSAASDSFA